MTFLFLLIACTTRLSGQEVGGEVPVEAAVTEEPGQQASLAPPGEEVPAPESAERLELSLPVSWRLRPEAVEETETVRFSVMGIDWDAGRVAFQQVYKVQPLYDESGTVLREPYPCAYPALAGLPDAGLSVGIWSITEDRIVERYAPYPAASDKEGCVVGKEDPLVWLTARGFPGAQEVQGTQPGYGIRFVLSNGIRILISQGGVDAEETPLADAFSDDFCTGLESLEYRVLGWPARRNWRPEQRCMASGGTAEVRGYWTRGSQVLLHEHYVHSNRFAGMSNTEAHSFTLLDLSDFPADPPCNAWAAVADPDPAGLNVRAEPRVGSPVVDRLLLGTRVHILEARDGWLLLDKGKFDVNEETKRSVIAPGWVNGSLLSAENRGGFLYVSPSEMRSQPSTSLEAVERVHSCQGPLLDVTEGGQRGWLGPAGLPVDPSTALPPDVEPQARIVTRPTAKVPQTFRILSAYEEEWDNWTVTHSHASAFAVHGATDFRVTLWESEDASDYKDYSMEGRLVSVVDNIVSFEIMEGGYREGAAHGFAIHQFGAVTLDWGFGDKVQGVPLKWLLQDELECLGNSGFYVDIPEDDMDMAVRALCESPQMEAPLRAVIEAAPPLRDMPEKDRGCAFQEEALTGTSYAFHHLEGDQVIVHLGLGHGCEVLRGAFTEVLFGYKPPARLMKELREAEKRGLLGHQLRPTEGGQGEQER